MRRSVARGRVFPQSYSTDRRYGRLSLKAVALFPLMWANADDQGRLTGDPEEIKYSCCSNIDHITKADIPGLLAELAKNDLIKVYSTSREEATQMLDWWDVHRPQWAWPSHYPPPEGWKDRLRYKRGAREVVTQNWLSQVSSQVSDNSSSGEFSGESSDSFPLTTPSEKETETEKGKRKEERGNSPERSGEAQNGAQVSGNTRSGETPSPSPANPHTEIEILDRLTECFKREWGRVPANRPHEIIPREPTARETAQLRDLAKELAAAGCPLGHIDQAFREAAKRPGKTHISYARAILLDWLDVIRGPPA